MKHTPLPAIITACVILGGSWSVRGEIPKGWFVAGSHPRDYQMSVDRQTIHRGKASAHLQSIVPQTSGFGTLMQTFKADAFRGRRVRMSGYVRSKELSDWAGLWMRVDGGRGESLAFDNMQDRPIKATTDWTKYEIVLDVPPQAEQISCGLLLTGRGEAWMDDVRIEAVSKETSTTAGSPVKELPAAPANLDFEQD